MKVLIVSNGGSYSDRILKRKGINDVTICSPGAMLVGQAFDVIYVDSSVLRDGQTRDWLESSVACRLKKCGVILS